MTTATPAPRDTDEARIDAILALADGHHRPIQEMALAFAIAGRTVEEFACAATAHFRYACKATRQAIAAAESAASVCLEKAPTP